MAFESEKYALSKAMPGSVTRYFTAIRKEKLGIAW